MNKRVAIVPPSGQNRLQDFALIRMALFFAELDIETWLIEFLDTDKVVKGEFTTYIVSVSSRDKLIEYLDNNSFDLILHRAWMHRYKFAGFLANRYKNIVIYIKDWFDEIPRVEYEFYWHTDKDFDGIKRLFESQKMILSHYDNYYTRDRWVSKYKAKSNNFIFIPEYPYKRFFYNRDKKNNYNKNTIKLVWAGTIPNYSLPEKLEDSKNNMKFIKAITSQGIKLDCVVLAKMYNKIFFTHSYLYKDYIYEDKFNNFFSIKLGGNLDTSKLATYDFAVFETTMFRKVSKESSSLVYAITSKFAFYMEAGLPVIVNKEMITLSNLVKEYDIGIVISNDDILKLDLILDIGVSRYNQLLDNVVKFRDVYTYNKNSMSMILNVMGE